MLFVNDLEHNIIAKMFDFSASVDAIDKLLE